MARATRQFDSGRSYNDATHKKRILQKFKQVALRGRRLVLGGGRSNTDLCEDRPVDSRDWATTVIVPLQHLVFLASARRLVRRRPSGVIMIVCTKGLEIP